MIFRRSHTEGFLSKSASFELCCHQVVGSSQRSSYVTGSAQNQIFLGEFFLTLSSTVASTAVSFLEPCKQKLSLLTLRGFCVAFGLQLGLSELGTSAVVLVFSIEVCRLDYEEHTSLSPPPTW